MLKKIVSAIVLVFAAVLAVRPAAAQGTNPPILLDDATPSIDVVVTPNNGASGVVYVELVNAHVTLKDATNGEVLTLIDKRVTALAIQLASGATSHTLHVERLPGATTAQVRIVAQGAMPAVDAPKSDTKLVALTDTSATKVALSPAQTLPVTVTDKADMVSAQFPAQASTVQLVDDKGAVLLTSLTGKEISGLAVKLTPGQYALNLANRDLTTSSEVEVSLSSGPTPTLPDNTLVANNGDPKPAGQVPANSAVACTATVNIASVNLRSGPGTGYTTLGSAGQATQLAVGGVNREGGWLLVKGPNGTAWIAQSAAALSGSCGSLAVFDIPLRNASQPVVVQQPQQPSVNAQAGGGEDHHENEQEGQSGEQHDNGGGHDD